PGASTAQRWSARPRRCSSSLCLANFDQRNARRLPGKEGRSVDLYPVLREADGHIEQEAGGDCRTRRRRLAELDHALRLERPATDQLISSQRDANRSAGWPCDPPLLPRSIRLHQLEPVARAVAGSYWLIGRCRRARHNIRTEIVRIAESEAHR